MHTIKNEQNNSQQKEKKIKSLIYTFHKFKIIQDRKQSLLFVT